jgi:6-phosphofructokinase 2
MLRELLDVEKVEHLPFGIQGMTRQNLTVFAEATDRQFRFGMPGPTLTAAEWQEGLDQLASLEPAPAYIVCSGSLPPGVPDDFYGRVASLGRERGSRIIVDTSEDALRGAARAGVYLLKPNMRELGQLVGHRIEGEAEQEVAARDLVDSSRAQIVVVSLGAAGALLVSRDHLVRVRAPTVRIRSKIGAGDSMVAGIVLALVRGQAPENAVRFGVAAGSAAVTTPGTELCRRGDTKELYERMQSEAG